MAGLEEIFPLLVLTAITGGFIAAIFLLFKSKQTDSNDDNALSTNNHNGTAANVIEKLEHTAAKRTNAAREKTKLKFKEDLISNPLLVASLKGHTGEVLDLDFSSNGKLLASCSEDRTIRIWNVKDFNEKEHKYSRDNVELDFAVSISFSPDCKAFLTGLSTGKAIQVSKIAKKKDSSGLSITQEFVFPESNAKADILSIGIASHGKYVMCAFKDTTIILYDLKGEILTTIDTLQAYNSHAEISPCGNLVGCCGFTPEVRLWHVDFNKDKTFKQVSRALELKGHSAGVYSFAYSNDCKRMASVSKDKSWKYWDTDVEYTRGQDSYLLGSGSYDSLVRNGRNADDKIIISLSPDTFTVAIAVGKTIGLYDASTQAHCKTLEDVHSDLINCLRWHPASRQLASSGGCDRTIRIWHNPVGPKAVIEDLKQKVTSAKTDSHKQRILEQIEEARFYLKSINA